LYSSEDILFYSCATVSICWFILKFICKSRGYPISFFVNHQWDIANGVKILRHDDSASVRILTGTVFIGLFISFIIFILNVIEAFLEFWLAINSNIYHIMHNQAVSPERRGRAV
jgi:hypothetical protein